MSQIQKFYSDTNVLITGGTGFMGQILIEKLLRSTNVSTIYLIVRKKKGKDMFTRVEEICDDVIFERLKEISPKFKHRIVAVAGDVSLAGLGLNTDDRKILIENVNVVFHLAATVRFDEHLKLAFSINVNGINECLDLCKQMKNLKSVVHVSTAYSNCIFEKIEEKFYDYEVSYDGIKLLLSKASNEEISDFTPKLLGKWPNTYTFTKALAEDLVRKHGCGVPIGIFRPAIVLSTNQEPVPGWINNLYGPTGICMGAMTGVLRTAHCDESKIADVIPVDTCVAGLIATAWDIAEKNCKGICDNIPIYNYVSSPENPLTWGEFNDYGYHYCMKYPLSKSMWAITFKATKNKTLFFLNKLLHHYIPAVILDFFFLVLGKKPRFVNMYTKIHKFSGVLSYFSTRQWTFTNENTVKLWNKMSQEDKKIFPVSMAKVHWPSFFDGYVIGIREYLLKDTKTTVEKAKKRQKLLSTIHSVLKYSLYSVFSYTAYCCYMSLQLL